MKKNLLYIALIAALLLCVWLLLPKQSKPKEALPPANETTNITSEFTAPNEPVSPSDKKKYTIWARPLGVDDAGWAYAKQIWQDLMSQNQPIEFYARALDQNGVPVIDAQLDLHLSSINEDLVAKPEFLHMNMGAEITNQVITLHSDEQGWIRLTGVRGTSVWVESLHKDGYTWTTPQIDSFGYKPGGKKSVGYSEMRDAFDPAKGYIFHMQKE